MRTNPKKDVFRKAEGDAVKTTAPTNGQVIEEKKFSVSKVTDKMGITTAGAITKGFFWGGAIVGIGLLVVGMVYKKINISYVK